MRMRSCALAAPPAFFLQARVLVEMGAGASKRKVNPELTVAQISVQPADTNVEEDCNKREDMDRGTSSLDSTMRATHSGAQLNGHPSSSDTTLRADSQVSRSIYSGRRRGAGYRSSRRIVGSRPVGGFQTNYNAFSAKRLSWQGDRGISSAGLPLQRDLDLDSSGNTISMRERPIPTSFNSPDTDFNTVILLGKTPNVNVEQPTTCCQLCGNVFNTLRVPFLLLCGHSYCGQCIDCATEKYPSALRCGVCSIVTPLGQQNTDSLPRNEPILDLVTSREFTAMVNEKNVEKCAECIHHPASVYCSECSASYCSTCAKKAHEGSRVRSKHKPVPINLKPRPQPTCRKHPGQSCVLYCETEKQPMCVLCKFYNQHRFHKFDLLSKVASKYTTSVTDKLSKLEIMEQDLNTTAQSLAHAVDEVNNSAKRAQERLERHCSDLRKSYCTTLEHRETVLLTLLDRQVELKQDMIEEARMEVAAARARIIAAKEEANQILKLNPVTAILSRKHMDANFERALKRTLFTTKPPTQSEVPLSLLPDIKPTITEALGQHGAVLQIPPKPSFLNVSVTTNTLMLKWECPHEYSSDVTADRTLTFSLHCHADVPLEFKAFKKQFNTSGKQITPESGFEDFSGSSVEPSSNFPSVPQSLLGSRNISLIALGQADTHNADVASQKQSAKCKVHAIADTKLPEIVKSGVGVQGQQSLLPPSLLPSSASAARLNLPPLRQTHETLVETETDHLSDSTTISGTLADSEDPASPPIKKGASRLVKKKPKEDTYSTDSSSSLTNTTVDTCNPSFTNVGRFCRGFAFDEIYRGEEYSFLYSGLFPGATYYFRVHCHNAAGWGPWSDTVKCTTILLNK